MAVVTGTVVSAGLAAYSANQQRKGAQGAANAANEANQAAINEQRRQYDATRQDLQPWMEQGNWGLDRQRAFLEGDTSGFEDSADYVFAREQGLRGLDRQLASNLGGASGGADVDRMKYATGLANQNMDNYYARITGVANAGQTAASNLGTFGANAANQIGNAWQNIGDARQSAYQTRADATSQFAGVLGGMASGYGNYFAGRSQAAPTNAWASGFGNNTDWLTNGQYGGGAGVNTWASNRWGG